MLFLANSRITKILVRTLLIFEFSGVSNIFREIFTYWANFCLSFYYFPLILRQGEVVFFLKQWKTQFELICLYPVFGKLLEKILAKCLIVFLVTNKLLRNKQFVFREIGHVKKLFPIFWLPVLLKFMKANTFPWSLLIFK